MTTTTTSEGVRVKVPTKRNFERLAYLFMRLSGIALLFLAIGHLMIQLVLNDVHNLTLVFVANQWEAWGWKVYDMLLLVFAVTHGYNGLRNVLEDYIHNDSLMKTINVVLVIFIIVTIGWSAVAIANFDADLIREAMGS